MDFAKQDYVIQYFVKQYFEIQYFVKQYYEKQDFDNRILKTGFCYTQDFDPNLNIIFKKNPNRFRVQRDFYY